MPGIVVGVDGSPNSGLALDWAMRTAAAQHAPLTVIAVHQLMRSYFSGGPVELAEDLPELERTRKLADEMTRKAAGRLGDERPASIEVRAVNGFAAQELLEASKSADLLVVGSRGGGGFARLLLGSVSTQVVNHAACPVVVVPHDRSASS